MSDPRCTPSNGRVAHVSLRGVVEAAQFVAGEDMAVNVAAAPILRTPGGPVDRELLFGQTFVVLEKPAEPGQGHAYGYAARDGYCGYIQGEYLHAAPAATHSVAARQTYYLPEPDLKSGGERLPLYFGSCLQVIGEESGWSEVFLLESASSVFVPNCHLRPIDATSSDPVAVARLFLGAPYVWGGNTGAGIDCSGLIQAAFLACGVPCPGDSDLQAAMAGETLSEATTLEPGDLLFWKGHVALATGPATMIHANAHHMMVVEESIAPAVARIAATDTGAITRRLRPRHSTV